MTISLLILNIITFSGKDSEETCRTNVCGGTFENFNGCEFQTLNYPKEYLPNQNCTWHIHAPRPQDKLEIKFTDFRIDTSLYCTLDHLAVFDGTSISQEDQLGNNLCKEITAKRVKFTSNGECKSLLDMFNGYSKL